MKNKFYFVLIILFLTVHSFAQNDLSKLDGYKVIYLPYHFSNTISYIFDKFRSVGFKVYTDESTLKADKDVIIDPGLILTCQVDQSYSYPHTTIGIKLANIKSETLYQRTENTTSKSFVSFDVNKDQKWVIDKLFEPLYSYSFDIRKSLAVVEINNLPVVEMTNWTENSIKSYLSSNNLDPIEGIYKSYQEDRRRLR